MSDNTKIEWTEATYNPITGCSVLSAGCKHCYAMKLAGTRLRNHPSRAGLTIDTKAGPVWTGDVRLNKEWLLQPWHWTRPRRIFVCAHSDLFHPAVPFKWIAAIFWIMAHTTRHTYQVLTKRPERAREFFAWVAKGKKIWADDRIGEVADQFLAELGCKPEWEPARGGRGGYDNCGPGWPYENVWLGVSVENQEAADTRVPILMDLPAAVRWISAEPLLGPVDLTRVMRRSSDSEWTFCDNALTGFQAHKCGGHTSKAQAIHWVVAGGESGNGARPIHPDWARALRDQCSATGTAFFFKQWGEWASVSDVEGDGEHHRFADGATVRRVGKKAAGRRLDGREHSEYPNT